MINSQIVDILYVSEKLFVACLPRAIRKIFFVSHHTLLLLRQIMKNSENMGHITTRTVR